MRFLRFVFIFVSPLLFAQRKNYGQRAFMEIQIQTPKGPASCHLERITTTSDMPSVPNNDVSYALLKGCGGSEHVIENTLPTHLKDRFSALVEKQVYLSDIKIEEQDCPESLKELTSVKVELAEGIDGWTIIDSFITGKQFISGNMTLLGQTTSSSFVPLLQKTTESKCSLDLRSTEEEKALLGELKDYCLSLL